jgi:hypothetical protein
MAFPKRRRDGEFHKMFPSIPEDEILIRDYSCAWNKDILHHGRIYLSLNWLCFKDGLFNADLNIKLEDVRSVAKQKTAYVIPNAIEVSTVDDKKLFFTTFNNRNRTFYDIVRIWTNNVNGKPDTQTDLLVELSQKPELNPNYKEKSPKKMSGSTSGSSDTDVVTMEDILKKHNLSEQHYLLGTGGGDEEEEPDKGVSKNDNSGSEYGFEKVADIDGHLTPMQLAITPAMFDYPSSLGEDTSTSVCTLCSGSDSNNNMEGEEEPPKKQSLVDSPEHLTQSRPFGMHLFSGSGFPVILNRILRFCVRPTFLFNFLMIIL